MSPSGEHVAAVGAVAPFVTAMQELRARVGNPGSRKIAAQLGTVSHTTVAEAFSGRRIPTWPVVAAIVDGLGGDSRLFRQLWQDATNETPTQTEAERESEAFLTRYRRLATSYYSVLYSFDFDRSHRASIDSVYVPQTVIRRDSSDREEDTVEMNTFQFDQVVDRAVLLGDPGAGKSALCQVLMHHHASNLSAALPFMVPVREIATAAAPTMSVVSLIENRLRTGFQAEPPDGLIERLLIERPTLVIFDGLDELTGAAMRAEMASAIEMFAAQAPLARILITSRIPSYRETVLDPSVFKLFQILPFNTHQTAQFIRQRLAADAEAGAVAAIDDLDNAILASISLPRTPLALALACDVYQRRRDIPKNVVELYTAYWDLRLRRWDQSRGISGVRQLDPAEVNAIGYLALNMINNQQDKIAASDAYQLVFQALVSHVGNVPVAEVSSRDLLDQLRGRASILLEVARDASGDGVLSFAHRAFMEYAAASHLANEQSSPATAADAILDRVVRGGLREVATLVAQMVDKRWRSGGRQLIERLLDKLPGFDGVERRSVIEFLAQCTESIKLPPDLVARIRDSDPDGGSQSAADQRSRPVEGLDESGSDNTVPVEVRDAFQVMRSHLMQATERKELRALVATWSWATLEACIRGKLPAPQRTLKLNRGNEKVILEVEPDLVNLAVEHGLISDDGIEGLKLARRIRNSAAHGTGSGEINYRDLVYSFNAIQATVLSLFK
jgi:NACHT domain